jgi:hypothetical protein
MVDDLKGYAILFRHGFYLHGKIIKFEIFIDDTDTLNIIAGYNDYLLFFPYWQDISFKKEEFDQEKWDIILNELVECCVWYNIHISSHKSKIDDFFYDLINWLKKNWTYRNKRDDLNKKSFEAHARLLQCDKEIDFPFRRFKSNYKSIKTIDIINWCRSQD